MAPPDLRTFLERSLGVLARESPGSYTRFCRTLSGRRVCVAGDDDQRFALQFEADAVLATTSCGSEDIFTAVDSRAILAMVDGALTLEDALRQDRLVVRASVANAAAALDALLIYLRGAIRCPSFPGLLSEFRSQREEERRR